MITQYQRRKKEIEAKYNNNNNNNNNNNSKTIPLVRCSGPFLKNSNEWTREQEN